MIDFANPFWQQSFTDAVQVDARALRIDTTTVEHTLMTHLPDAEKDLLDVAMAAYIADRITPRSPGHPTDWAIAMTGRAFKLKVRVRKHSFWTQLHMQQSLEAALGFFTGDTWSFEFLPLALESVATPLFDEPVDCSFVGLFSGGLDSFAGAISQIYASGHNNGVLVASHTGSNLFARQREILEATNQKLKRDGKRLIHVPLHHHLDQRAISYAYSKGRLEQERTQRSRGFLFLALGISVARVLGLSTLNVYENGVGAINLPQTVSGLGVDYTRAMHPEGLRRMATLVSNLFETPIKIENPSLWKTKGQMCVEVQKRGFGDLAVQTVSCDGFPRHKPKSEEQCGVCTSCLLRRVSLAAGDLKSLDRDQKTYETDVYNTVPTAFNNIKLLPLHCMETQAERLRYALNQENAEARFASLLYEFPELMSARTAIVATTNLTIQQVTEELVKLFTTYVREWEWFSATLPRLPSHAA